MRRAAAAAVVLGVLTATAACSAHPGAAAVVDGHEISEAYLHETYQDFADLGSATPQQLLEILVALRATDDVAAQKGISVSAADALAALKGQGVDTSGFSPGGVEIARYLAMYQANQALAQSEQKAIAAAMDTARRAADIVVNPRYGSLNDTTGAVDVATPPAWIVTKDAAPAPAAK